MLIAKLVDTNADGVVSIGDTEETNEYPLDLNASSFAAFQTTSHIVDTVDSVTFRTARVLVSGAAFDFSAPYGWDSESYSEVGVFGDSSTVTLFSDRISTSFEDRILANAASPSSPGSTTDQARLSPGTDDSFVDVDIFI